jgi:hypothetical protein
MTTEKKRTGWRMWLLRAVFQDDIKIWPSLTWEEFEKESQSQLKGNPPSGDLGALLRKNLRKTGYLSEKSEKRE